MDFNTIKHAISKLPAMPEPIKAIPVSQELYDHFIEQAHSKPQPDTWRHPMYEGIELVIDPELTGMSFKVPDPMIEFIKPTSGSFDGPEITTWSDEFGMLD